MAAIKIRMMHDQDPCVLTAHRMGGGTWPVSQPFDVTSLDLRNACLSALGPDQVVLQSQTLKVRTRVEQWRQQTAHHNSQGIRHTGYYLCWTLLFRLPVL